MRITDRVFLVTEAGPSSEAADIIHNTSIHNPWSASRGATDSTGEHLEILAAFTGPEGQHEAQIFAARVLEARDKIAEIQNALRGA